MNYASFAAECAKRGKGIEDIPMIILRFILLDGCEIDKIRSMYGQLYTASGEFLSDGSCRIFFNLYSSAERILKTVEIKRLQSCGSLYCLSIP